MSKIINHIRLMVPSGTALQTPKAMVDKWTEGFKRSAQIINERRKARIPHGEAFTQRLAGVSSSVAVRT